MDKYENGVKKITIDDVLQVTDEEATKKLSEELKMNRPELEEYKAFVKEGLIVPKLVQYTTDLGKYCDELEATLKCTQESWWGTMGNLDKHMKALDKLAEFAVSKQRLCFRLMGFDEIEVDNSSFSKEKMKEWAMEDD